MFAEQLPRHHSPFEKFLPFVATLWRNSDTSSIDKLPSPPIGVTPPEWIFDRDKHLDLYPLFVLLWNESLAHGPQQAVHHLRTFMTAQFRAYTQENNASAIFPTVVNIRRKKDGSLRYRHSYHEDVVAGNNEELGRIADETIRHRYALEHEAYYAVWGQLTQEIESLIGMQDKTTIIEILQKKGFRKKIAHKSKYEQQKKKLSGHPEFAALFDTVSGVAALFPMISDLEEIELYEIPNRRAFISPSTPIHNGGKTSIGRLSTLWYIPKLNEFIIPDEGLYSGYQKEIQELLKLDRDHRPIPTTEEELLQFIAIVSEYPHLSPHALFQLIIDRIGYFTPAPVGENVRIRNDRTFAHQLEYTQQILLFEYLRCVKKPTLLSTLSQRLEYANEIVMHALLRANDTTLDVKQLVRDYQDVFSLDTYVQHPQAAEQKMNAHTARSYPDIFNRAVSVADCALSPVQLGGFAKFGHTQAFDTKLAFGVDFQGNNAFNLRDGIKMRRTRDFQNEAEARAFARMYGIDESWIGTVIKHYPEGKECDTCPSNPLKKRMHWVGQCGDHTMCLQCNAQYNLDHGLVQTPDAGMNTNSQESGEQTDVATQERSSIGLTPFIASLATPWILQESSLLSARGSAA